eukprot:scpid50260/ scgid28750/ Sushi, von Willebrand factor type A, EGF and pentraxin domain-containing protein 1
MAFKTVTIAFFAAICLALPAPTPAPDWGGPYSCRGIGVAWGYLPFTKRENWNWAEISVRPICQEGFNVGIYGRCEGYGRWLNKRSTSYCQPKDITCPAPEIANGARQQATVRFPKTAHYSCSAADGYILVGNARPWCTPQGTLQPLPSCKYVNCTVPSIENGQRQQATVGYSQTARYSCSPGYLLDGDAQARCTSQGTLDSLPPRCKPVVCKVTALGNGWSPSYSIVFPGAAQYTCVAGFVLEGDPRPKCTTEGVISSFPHCRAINCTAPDIPNGSKAQARVTFPKSALYSCNPGYTMSGDATPACTTSGKLISTPNCLPINCSVPSIENGQSKQNPVFYTESAQYSCSFGLVIIGDPQPRCTVHGSLSSVPKCEESCIPSTDCPHGLVCRMGLKTWCSSVNCTVPDIPNGNKDQAMVLYPTTARYSCKPGYTMAGNDTPDCKFSGQLSSTPSCMPINCSVPSIGNGTNQQDRVVYPGSAQYSCSSGLMLIGDAQPRCTASGSLSSVPTCEEYACIPSTECPDGLVCRKGLEAMCTRRFTAMDRDGVDRSLLHLTTNARYTHANAENACSSMGLSLPTNNLRRSIPSQITDNTVAWTRETLPGNKAYYVASSNADTRQGWQEYSLLGIHTSVSGLICEEVTKELTCSTKYNLVRYGAVASSAAVSTCRLYYHMDVLKKKVVGELENDPCFKARLRKFGKEGVEAIWIAKSNGKLFHYNIITGEISKHPQGGAALICYSKARET